MNNLPCFSIISIAAQWSVYLVLLANTRSWKICSRLTSSTEHNLVLILNTTLQGCIHGPFFTIKVHTNSIITYQCTPQFVECSNIYRVNTMSALTLLILGEVSYPITLPLTIVIFRIRTKYLPVVDICTEKLGVNLPLCYEWYENSIPCLRFFTGSHGRVNILPNSIY